MKRAQSAYKDQLSRRLEKLRLELAVKEEELKKAKTKREDIGVELYGTQQQLARQQMQLEKVHDSYNTVAQIRAQCEQSREQAREDYGLAGKDRSTYEDTVNKHQAEYDKLSATLKQIERYNSDVQAQIAVTKRATQKAEDNVAHMETQKKRQDILVDQLSEQVKTLQRQLDLYTAQTEAQSGETKAATELLREASEEMDAIVFEKKQLMQQWKSSLIGMQRRDEAFSAAQGSLDKQKEVSRALDNELLGYRQGIREEQERNETLTVLLNKLESEQAFLKRQMETIADRSDKVKESYSMYTKSLRHTEMDMAQTMNVKQTLASESAASTKKIEEATASKQELEDKVMAQLQDKTTLEKYSTHTKRTTGKLRERVRSQQHAVAQRENDLSRASIQITNVRSRINNLRGTLNETLAELKAKDALIEKYEAEIRSKNDIIEKRQAEADKCNRRFDELMSMYGGDVNYGPMEAEINSLQKSIAQKQNENASLQQFWLRNQNELVGMVRSSEGEQDEITELKGRLTVMNQKKMRLNSDISSHEQETTECRRNITALQNDMIKLNRLVAKNTGVEKELEEGNLLLANEFVSRLKEAEKESMQLESALENTKEEKKRILGSLVEAERQIMLWEKKIQLAKETAATLDPEVGAAEIRSMKNEIHRMKLRFSQLEKVQEKMIKEMEKSIYRRESIAARGSSSAKNNGMTQAALKKRIAELQKKLKQTTTDTAACEHDIRELHDAQNRVGQEVEAATARCQQARVNEEALTRDFENKANEKRENLEQLTYLQRQAKRYQAVREGKYRMLARNEESLENGMSKEENKLQQANQMLDQLVGQFPHLTQPLAPVSRSIAQKLN